MGVAPFVLICLRECCFLLWVSSPIHKYIISQFYTFFNMLSILFQSFFVCVVGFVDFHRMAGHICLQIPPPATSAKRTIFTAGASPRPTNLSTTPRQPITLVGVDVLGAPPFPRPAFICKKSPVRGRGLSGERGQPTISLFFFMLLRIFSILRSYQSSCFMA